MPQKFLIFATILDMRFICSKPPHMVVVDVSFINSDFSVQILTIFFIFLQKSTVFF